MLTSLVERVKFHILLLQNKTALRNKASATACPE